MASTSNSPSPPSLDLNAIAKTTRKTLDRLASFSHMRSSSDGNPLLTKILNKILALINLVDASMLVAQLGYQLAADAVIYCDSEASDWEADVTIDGLRATAGRAQEISKSVMDGFREIKQEVYKIAASTKDDMFVVLVPPDPTHSETMKIHLKDVGTDLVANLSLLSDYARAMTGLAEWSKWVHDDLMSDAPTLLPESSVSQSSNAKYTFWTDMKEAFQEYYNVINTTHQRFPELLGQSSAAWKSVALARSAAPSTAPHSLHEMPTLSHNTPTPPAKGWKAMLSSLGKGRGGRDQKTNSKHVKPADEKVAAYSETDKGKEKQRDAPVLPLSVSSRSSSSMYSEPSQVRSSAVPSSTSETVEVKGRFPFSCCSGNLFQDGVAFLGTHAYLSR